jgi:hypothetical protein
METTSDLSAVETRVNPPGRMEYELPSHAAKTRTTTWRGAMPYSVLTGAVESATCSCATNWPGFS